MNPYNKIKEDSWQELIATFRFLEKKKSHYFIGMIGISLGYSGMAMISAFLLKYMIDLSNGTDKSQMSTYISYSILGILFLVVISGAFQALYEISGRYAVSVIRKKINEKRKKLPYTYFDTNQSGDILTKIIYDIDRVNANLTNNIKNVLSPILSCLFTLIPMCILSLELTVILSVITVLFLIFNIKYRKCTKKIGFELSLGMQNLSNKITDLLKGRLTIKVNAIEAEYSDQFQSINANYTQTMKRQNKLYARLESVNVVFTLMSSLVFIAVGAIYVSQNKTTFGTLVSLIALQESLTYGCLTASRKVPVVFENLASTRRICDFLDIPECKDDGVNEMPKNGIIRFENVDFAYEGHKPIFKNMNLMIKENQFIIIQGTSGSGKSSLIKLLLGFYRPTGGKIRIKDPSKMIAYVPQMPFLYSDTIRNNILYGKLDATDREYDWAVKMAYADEVMDKLPGGDATLVESKRSIIRRMYN